MTPAQIAALLALCERYRHPFDPAAFHPQFDLPTGWVAGWVGPPTAGTGPHGTIYVGCSPDGDIHS